MRSLKDGKLSRYPLRPQHRRSGMEDCCPTGMAVVDRDLGHRTHTPCDTFFGPVKNIDVARVSWRIAVERCGSRNVAVRIAVSRKQAENIDLNLRERHGMRSRCLPRVYALRGRLRSATLPR
jgi:hypothetical protein